MRGFLTKVKAAEDSISLEAIYTRDHQFVQMVSIMVSLVENFSAKFNLPIDDTLDLFIRQVKKGL